MLHQPPGSYIRNGTAVLFCSGEVYTWGDNDEGQLGDGTTNAIQRPRLVAALQGKKINRVACGSAHTLAWSTSKPTNAGKLPAQVSQKCQGSCCCSSTPAAIKLISVFGLFQVPMEYNHLQEISIMALRNRLLLLHHISELFCPCIPMFDLEGRLGQTGHGPSVGFDTLRGILISQGKVRRHQVSKNTQQLSLSGFYNVDPLKTQTFYCSVGAGSSFQEGGPGHHGEGQTAWTCGGAEQNTGRSDVRS